MWASSVALNSILDAGTVHGCACHAMEHELSAYYDITHGHGLAIEAVSDFCFNTLGLKSNLSDLDIDDKHFRDMAEHACGGGVISGPKDLTPDDVEKITGCV